MSHNSKDNLFRFFRSRLKASNKEADWNTPPDSVFDNAMGELVKTKENKRRRILVPLILAGGFILLSFISFSIYDYINGLNTKVQNLEE